MRGFMSQSETAGGRITFAGELPRKGLGFPDFELMSSAQHPIRLSDYRGRSSLVLIFMDDQRVTTELLSAVAHCYDDFKHEEAEVIAVAKSSPEECARIKGRLKLPFVVLSDGDGRIHREVGASDEQGQAAAAAYVIDRYGEIFAIYRRRDGQALPNAAEILNWLEFVNSQCPECEPPEWPV
jgi:thioredoxin-dependent peroxiredoxin